MRWQIILPIVLAVFFTSCSNNTASIQPKQKAIIIDEFYSNYPVQLFDPNATIDIKLDIEKLKLTKNKEIIYKVLNEARSWVYTPYKLGGVNKNKGADCSAFTQQIYKNAFGVDIQRTTVYQRKFGKKISRKNLKAGDLLFFKTDGPLGLHVGIYLDNNNFIHLSSKGGSRIQNLNVRYWSIRFIEGRRYEIK